MMEPKNKKAFCVQNKMYILPQMDDDKEMCCTDCQNGIVLLMFITTVKNMKDNEKC